jgi:hypothetical protein
MTNSSLENVLVEVLLQLLVRQVDAQLRIHNKDPVKSWLSQHGQHELSHLHATTASPLPLSGARHWHACSGAGGAITQRTAEVPAIIALSPTECHQHTNK